MKVLHKLKSVFQPKTLQAMELEEREDAERRLLHAEMAKAYAESEIQHHTKRLEILDARNDMRSAA